MSHSIEHIFIYVLILQLVSFVKQLSKSFAYFLIALLFLLNVEILLWMSFVEYVYCEYLLPAFSLP